MKNPEITNCNSTQELLEGEMQFLQEEVDGLAEDLIELDDRVDKMLDIEQGLCENGMRMCDLIKSNYESIKKLEESTDFRDEFLFWLAVVVVVWNILLTLNAFNVF